MEIYLLRKDDPLESGAIYQHMTAQARGTKVKASYRVESKAHISPVPSIDDEQNIVTE
jgi:hypothetical protein